jgi:hypothetical protein
MVRLAAAAAVLSLSATFSLAQPVPPPIPLLPGAPLPSFEPEPLPPVAPAPELPGERRLLPQTGPAPPDMPRSGTAPEGTVAGDAPAGVSPDARIFCNQPVTVHIADRDTVPERYRPFIGIWSDAAWTPQLCAALIVEDVGADGLATIVYAFGPMGANTPGPGGVLHGTGIISDDELRFQNADDTQFAFRPLYSDLEGQLTTPQGQNHHAIFKKTF